MPQYHHLQTGNLTVSIHRAVPRTRGNTGKTPLDSKEMSASDLNTHDMLRAVLRARDNDLVLRH